MPRPLSTLSPVVVEVTPPTITGSGTGAAGALSKALLAPIPIPLFGIAGLQSTNVSGGPDERGRLDIDPSIYFPGNAFVTRTVVLVVNLSCGAGSMTATLELFNVTDGLSVRTLSTSNTSSTTLSSTLVIPTDLPNALRSYSFRLSKTGGAPTDVVYCKFARIDIIYS